MDELKAAKSFRHGVYATVFLVGTYLIGRAALAYDEKRESERMLKREIELLKEQRELKPLTQEEWSKLQKIKPTRPYEK